MKKQEIDIKDKVNYVIRAKGLGSKTHHCHYPGCQAIVKPQFWGCLSHWNSLPSWARAMIWAAYIPGQEQTKNPSHHYIDVVERVNIWIIANEMWQATEWFVRQGNYKNLGVEFHPL